VKRKTKCFIGRCLAVMGTALWLVGALALSGTCQGRTPGGTAPEKNVSSQSDPCGEDNPCGDEKTDLLGNLSLIEPASPRKIDLARTKEIFDRGEAVFIDGRSPMAFATRRIRGARNCTLGRFEADLAELKKSIPLDRRLVVYCGGETCSLSEKIARRLTAAGYANVLVFEGGWPAWAQAGYPMEP